MDPTTSPWQITDTEGCTRRIALTEDHTLYHQLIDGVDAVWDSDAAQEHS